MIKQSMYMSKIVCILLLLVSFSTQLMAQNIDVISYDLIVQISDSSNKIDVVETLKFARKTESNKVTFNLTSQNTQGEGMKISALKVNGESSRFVHDNNTLTIDIDPSIRFTKLTTLTVHFSGIPQDGLIIGENRFGNRTFFGDNWPNRAQHWFVCNDHPSDKALVDFSIIAPAHYEVIANGEFKGAIDYASGLKMHSFSSGHPLPTKVIVFGAADFSIEELTEFKRFQLTSWVYPENEEAGFSDMRLAIDVLNYFESKISPFPYEKLANVQSTTRYGGMENAGCIFYSERAITGKGMMEELIAHEIAHQWFGNSATESDWSHLWLSEGFATYLTHLYVLQKFGAEKFEEGLAKDRQTVKHFYKQQILPIVDTISTDPNEMLNANAYQRGAWTLHMLRTELGDELFWKGIKAYYSNYQYSNATTADFIRTMEKTTGKNLNQFSKQWLRTGVLPELKLDGSKKKNKFNLIITQKQLGDAFHFPLDIELTLKDGNKEIHTIDVHSITTEVKIKASGKIASIEYDPHVKLLFLSTH